MRTFLPERIKRVGHRTIRYLLARMPNPIQTEREELLAAIASKGIPALAAFSKKNLQSDVLSFVESMRVGPFKYRYSPSTSLATLYSSVYACLLQDLFGEVTRMPEEQRRQWADYFDSFQSAEDGLFRDPAVRNAAYEDSDWWGARHLQLHIVAAYAALGMAPRYRFGFLAPFKDPQYLLAWLESHDWTTQPTDQNDIDNKIMNVVCVLQFERDFYEDQEAAAAVHLIQDHLLRARNGRTGMWGAVNPDDPRKLSRSVQFAYHLYPIYFYDHREIQDRESLIDLVLKTQNHLGGFGVAENSSACEDMDSLELLCRLSCQTSYRACDVELALRRALAWIFANQNEDGGFVFRRNEALVYGHEMMSSGKNESAMFPTWFRTLAIAYAATRLGLARFEFSEAPGYQFWKQSIDLTTTTLPMRSAETMSATRSR